MKSILNMALRLSLICGIAALTLANVAEVTRQPIAEAEARAQREAVEAVLPTFTQLVVDTVQNGEDDTVEYFSGVDATGITGTAFTSVSGLGYSGEIEIILGVNPKDEISGVRILRHAETPGLGANYADPEVLNRFYTGRLLDDNWKVTKDGGEVDALTGATITGRAIADAIERGIKQYRVDRDRIKAEPAPTEAEEMAS